MATPRTLASWKATQAAPASTSSLLTVLIETSAMREIDRMDEPFAQHGEDLGVLREGQLFYVYITLSFITRGRHKNSLHQPETRLFRWLAQNIGAVHRRHLIHFEAEQSPKIGL